MHKIIANLCQLAYRGHKQINAKIKLFPKISSLYIKFLGMEDFNAMTILVTIYIQIF